MSDRSPVRLDVADLRRRAARQIGRRIDTDDPGLEVLVADAATANLTDLGRLAVRAKLVRRIVTAEELADTLARWPQVEDVVAARPLVIVGLPRTGTTLLHGLLACDRAAFAPRFWQLQRPMPPSSSAFERGMRYARAALTVSAARAMLPTLRDVHAMATRQPEECVFLFRDIGIYAVAFPAYGYLRWLQGEGAGAVDYSGYRRHLQVLLSSQSGRRPVLKSPFHLGHLNELLAVFPDALVVHTRREPTAALASWCSFAATIGRGTVASLDLSTLGQSWLDFWAHAAEGAVAVRGAVDARDSTTSDTRISSRIRCVRCAGSISPPTSSSRRPRSSEWSDGSIGTTTTAGAHNTATTSSSSVSTQQRSTRDSAPTDHCDAATSPSVPVTLHSPKCRSVRAVSWPSASFCSSVRCLAQGHIGGAERLL